MFAQRYLQIHLKISLNLPKKEKKRLVSGNFQEMYHNVQNRKFISSTKLIVPGDTRVKQTNAIVLCGNHSKKLPTETYCTQGICRHRGYFTS
jgi:hypothetical protein